MSAKLLDEPEPEHRFLGGVVQDVQADQTAI
jgi:hypothetical protein